MNDRYGCLKSAAAGIAPLRCEWRRRWLVWEFAAGGNIHLKCLANPIFCSLRSGSQFSWTDAFGTAVRTAAETRQSLGATFGKTRLMETNGGTAGFDQICALKATK